MTTVAWVIGARGLLGSALLREIRARDRWSLLETEPLDWQNDAVLAEQVDRSVAALLASVRTDDDELAIVWAAGAAVTSSSPTQLDAELAQLESILARIGAALGSKHAPFSIFYSSSAGGVYGGSDHPPFNESTAPAPLGAYGDFKLRAERAIVAFATRHRVSSLVGRIANLYGPGQRLDKMQGLISHIAKAQVSATPASIYVSLDTIRDYIFVDDCAELICDSLDRLAAVSRTEGELHVTKILASGEGTTIAALLGYFRTLSKGHPNVMLGSSANASLQGLDLRLRSTVWPDLDFRQLTPLPAGIHATVLDIQSGVQRGF